MTNALFILGGPSLMTTGVTLHTFTGSGTLSTQATEANAQIIWRTAGTFTNLYCNVTANSTTAGNTTIKYRKTAANGNELLTITHGTTGEFQDTVNNDVAASGDKINWQAINATGGSMTYHCLCVQFAPTTAANTVNKLICDGVFTDTTVSANYFMTLSGQLGSAINSNTEANAQFTNKAPATLKNLYTHLSANTASVATIKSRVGGNPGNLSISIGSGVTGALEDTTNNDSISSGNLVNTVINSTITTTFTINDIGVDYLTTTGQTHYIGGDSSAIVGVGAASTLYMSLCRDTKNFSSTENTEQGKALAMTASNLEAFAITNGITATSNINFRIGGVNGNQTIAFGSGVTGYMEDTTDNDVLSTGNEINYQAIAGSTGTTIVFGTIGILGTYAQTGQNLNSILFGAIA